MAKKKSTLGRGLDALLASRDAQKKQSSGGVENAGLHSLKVQSLQPGQYQPRKNMNPEKLQELADSIQSQGIVQPIVVRHLQGERYEIIAGERRWRAAKMAGLDEVPVIIKDVSDQQTIAMALIENIQREDLNPLEEALALDRLIREFTLTHQQAADAVGRSRAAVSNLLRLLDLQEGVKQMLVEGELEMGHARCLLSLDATQQLRLAQAIAEEKLSVRQAEARVAKLKQPASVNTTAPARKDPDVKQLEQTLSERLCCEVSIKPTAKGGGKLIVQYYDNEQLQGILDRLDQ